MGGTGSFKLLSRQRVFQNSKFDVFSDTLVCPDGSVVKDYLSVIPLVSSREGITGVAVLPVLENRIGLLSVDRHPMGREGWEIPRGFVDAGESFLNAAVRELREETGLEASVDCLTPVGTIAPDAGLVKGLIRLFAAEPCKLPEETRKVQELGHRSFQYFTFPEVSDLLDLGAIRDPSTLVSILSFFRKRNRTGSGTT
ncbi:MAG: NUDIX hydrolase [Leptospirales bacterium]